MSHLGLPCKQIACKAEAERGTEEKIGPSLLFCHFPNQSRKLSPLPLARSSHEHSARASPITILSPIPRTRGNLCVERNLAGLLLYRKRKNYLAMLHHSLDPLTPLKMETIGKLAASTFFKQHHVRHEQSTRTSSSRLARLG